MKKLIVYIMLMCSAAMAVEYGYFSRADDDNSTPFTEDPVVLNENDVFIFMRTFANEYTQAIFTLGGELSGIYDNIITLRNGYGSQSYDEHMRSIPGPCTIMPTTQYVNTTVIFYKIIRAADSAAPSDSKYTASLNADGTRLAIGEQQGTNTSARVYEYDDVTEAWEQLGDNVE